MHTIETPQLERLMAALQFWSAARTGIDGLALVGSWSPTQRDHAECDVDLVCVVDDPDQFRGEQAWMREIDWPSAGLALKGWTDVDSGRARACHLTFDGGEAVEVSFVDRAWANTDPVDPVTRRIAGEGLRVLHDPHRLLGRLLVAL